APSMLLPCFEVLCCSLPVCLSISLLLLSYLCSFLSSSMRPLYLPVTLVPEACGKPWWPKNLDVTRHWPWEVSLRVENEHVCGGALIDLDWVVTAAHCIQGTKEYSVILGTSKLKPTDSTRALLIPVRDIIMHPKYWGQNFITGDVALLQLHTPVVVSKYVQPICLPEPNYNLKVGTWGAFPQGEVCLASLFVIIIRKRSAPICLPRDFDFLPSRTQRVGILGPPIPWVPAGSRASITPLSLPRGDPGGPLACEVEAQVHNPGVYTRITKYSKWIKKQISNGVLSVPCTSSWLLLLSWLLQPQMGP
uniref:Peptidase S1 domain-containing protein n=1 Tax=Monodon monoceros TaxID=40151 RepID=A0A8C6CKX1_MONMO